MTSAVVLVSGGGAITPFTPPERVDARPFDEADAGRIVNFTGRDQPYEPPLTPALVLPTEDIGPEIAAERVAGIVLLSTLARTPLAGHDNLARVVAAIARHAPQRVAYLSCDPATLARDAQRLQLEGYTVTQVDGFDLFPNTPHVETVAVFTRR